MSDLSWSDLDDLDEEEFLGVVGSGLEVAPVAPVAPVASPSGSDVDDLDEEEFIGAVDAEVVDEEGGEGEEWWEMEEARIIPTEDTYRQRFLDMRKRLRDDDQYVVLGSNYILVDMPLPNDGGRPHTMPSVDRPVCSRASPLAQVQNAADEDLVVEHEAIVDELTIPIRRISRAAGGALNLTDEVVDEPTYTVDNVEEAPIFTEMEDEYLEVDNSEYNDVDEQAQRCYYPAGFTFQLRYLDNEDILLVNDDGRTHIPYRRTIDNWSRPQTSRLSEVAYAYPATTPLAIAAVENDREHAVHTEALVAPEDDNSDDTSDSGYYSEEETSSLPPSTPVELTAIAENPVLTVTPDHACEYPVYTESPVTGGEDTVHTENPLVEEEVISFGYYFLGKSIVVLRSFQAVIDATLGLFR